MSNKENQQNDFEQKLYEEYENSLFRLAAFHALEQEGKKLRQEIEQRHPEDRIYPNELQMKRLKKQIEKELNRGRWLRRWQHLVPLANALAVIILAAVITLSVLVVNVEAVRNRVFNVFLTKNPESTVYQLEEEFPGEASTVLEASPGYWPSYVPEGYRLVKRDVSDQTAQTVYMCGEEQYLSLAEAPAGAKVYLDSENAEREEMILINGHDCLLIEKNGHLLLTWSVNERIFTLSSVLSLDEVIKVAESVEYKR